jgi:hypothetical protein
MSIKEFILSYRGCSKPECFGPSEQWWLFGLPLKQYPSMIINSLIIAVIFSLFFYAFKRKDMGLKKIVKVGIVAFIALLVIFYLFALFRQATTIY